MASRLESALVHMYVVCCALLLMSLPCLAAGTFSEAFYTNDGSENVNVQNGGQEVQLILTQSSGAGFASINSYLFGSVSMQIQLVPGNSAGTVTAFYLSSSGSAHDEIDFEFLGNVSGQPYLLQTNIYASGVGNREMRHLLWFDPTAGFHTYSALWTRSQIVFFVDSTPIRVFANNEAYGVPYLNQQPMTVYTTLWNGDSWATQGGTVKINWAAAPFVASFQNFGIDACQWQTPSPACAAPTASNWWNQPQSQSLTADQLSKLQSVQTTYLVYSYCNDRSRYPTPPAECAHNP